MCLFCEIAQHKESAKIFYEDETLIAIENKYPRDPVHILIMPKKHTTIKDLKEKDKNLLIKIFLLANQLAEKHKVSIGYELTFNIGNYAHVEHLHLHLMGGAKIEHKI